MTYELSFHPAALKEWKKLPPDIKTQFKKILERRLAEPRVPSAELSGPLQDCYKIKLRKAGYRLVYKLENEQLILFVIGVGKRNKNIIYESAVSRQTDTKSTN